MIHIGHMHVMWIKWTGYFVRNLLNFMSSQYWKICWRVSSSHTPHCPSPLCLSEETLIWCMSWTPRISSTELINAGCCSASFMYSPFSLSGQPKQVSYLETRAMFQLKLSSGFQWSLGCSAAGCQLLLLTWSHVVHTNCRVIRFCPVIWLRALGQISTPQKIGVPKTKTVMERPVRFASREHQWLANETGKVFLRSSKLLIENVIN